jgi:hypothetical protein
VLPSRYGEIVDAISTLDYEGIEQIFKSLSEKSDDHRYIFHTIDNNRYNL